jgi:hypothetical protein
MRTTLELPDSLFKHLKTRAAMEGSTLRDLVVQLVERGLQAPANAEIAPAALPSIRLGAPMALQAHEFSNANLSALLDEANE